MVNAKNRNLEQKALEAVKAKYTAARNASSFDFFRFARYYKLFRNRQAQKNYIGLSNLFVPEPYRIVRKKTAKLANAIRSINVIPEGQKDKEAAKIGTILLNFLRNKLNWSLKERMAIQESRIVGVGWLKVVWNLDKEEKDKPWRGFDLSFHATDRIFLPPEATIDDAFSGDLRYLIHEYETDLATLSKNPNYTDDDLKILTARSGGMRPDRTPLTLARLVNETRPFRQDPKQKKFRILEFWGKIALDDQMKDEKNSLIVIADNTLVLRFEDNPYTELLDDPAIPFVPIVANPIGQELYPVGDIEPGESLFNELNDTRNQRMDTVTLNIDPPKVVIKAANIDEKELIARRGWLIHSNIPNGIQFIPPSLEGVRTAIEEEKAIRGDIQQYTGVIDFAPGTNVQAGIEIDTARGAIIAKGEADALIEDEINILKVSLKMLYRIVLAYAQKFLDRQFEVRVVNEGVEQFVNMSSEQIKGNLDLDIEMKTLQDKTTDQQLKLLLFNQAKTVPGANMGKFFIDVLQAFQDNVNIQEYYQQPQPQQPEAPKVSVSLKGDLTGLQASQIYKQIPGVDPHFADPMMTQEGRDMMRGDLPEHHEKQVKRLELLSKQKDLMDSLGLTQNASDTGLNQQ